PFFLQKATVTAKARTFGGGGCAKDCAPWHPVKIALARQSERWGRNLSEQRRDGLAVADAVRAPFAVMDLGIRRQAKRMVDRGDQVLGRHRPVLGVGGLTVPRAVPLAPLDAAAGQQC